MITAIIISLIGITLMLFAVSRLLKIKELSKTGTKTEGVIFGLEPGDSRDSNALYPIIRFTTDKEEWITEKYTVGGFSELKEGKKVTVIYNPDKPTEFVVQSRVFNVVLGVLVVVGLVMFVVGVVGYIMYPDFFNRSGQP